jgi:hypothetical protein
LKSTEKSARTPRNFGAPDKLGQIRVSSGKGFLDAAFKEQALQKLAPAGKTVTRFKDGDALLTFLASL